VVRGSTEFVHVFSRVEEAAKAVMKALREARRIAAGIAVASCLMPLCAAITSATPTLSPQRMGFFEQQARLHKAARVPAYISRAIRVDPASPWQVSNHQARSILRTGKERCLVAKNKVIYQ